MMPGMDGFQFLRLLKSVVEQSHIPLVLLTAKNTLQSKIEGLGIGAGACLEKPFSPAHLQAPISNRLLNRSRLREDFAKSPPVHIKSRAHSRAGEHCQTAFSRIFSKQFGMTPSEHQRREM